MQKIIFKNGRAQVRLNEHPSEYYSLKYDWPKNSIWNLNGNLSGKLSKEKLRIIIGEKVYLSLSEKEKKELSQNYIELFLEEPNTMIAVYGDDFEECEDKLWDTYQKYLTCNHEFIRESKEGVHYSNGVGFCKHCGMYNSEAFEPETVCDECGVHSELLKLLDGREVCEECYEKESWMNKIGCSYFTSDTFMDYLRNHGCILESYNTMYNKNDELNIYSENCTIIKKDGTKGKIEWEFEKVNNGVLKVKNIKINNFYALAQALFGPKLSGQYYIINDGIELLEKKKEIIYENIKNKTISYDYPIKREIENIEKILEKNNLKQN